MGDHDLADAAASYLNAGLAVIALSGKQPNTAVHKQGLHQAITGRVEDDEAGEDWALLYRVFEHPETTGVGLPIPAHMVVVDIDGEEGAQQWLDLVGADGVAPYTPAAKTGRGLHLWFVTPKETGSRKLGPKLDLKGVGGYVAAPPSLHPDGHRYEWLEPLVIDGKLAPLEWLPDPIERMVALADEVRADFHVDRPVYTLYNITTTGSTWTLHTEPCPPPLDGLIKAVADAPEGNRNNLLAWATLQARDEGAKLEDVLRDLGGAAIEAGLTEREVRTTIRQAYRRSRRAQAD
ncbi:MAG TPA: bifunctional DNA primase/polymerase [Nocardioides sp.]|nr:bifunctional DNA primase/polymerase [Nocardioides sp.]